MRSTHSPFKKSIISFIGHSKGIGSMSGKRIQKNKSLEASQGLLLPGKRLCTNTDQCTMECKPLHSGFLASCHVYHSPLCKQNKGSKAQRESNRSLELSTNTGPNIVSAVSPYTYTSNLAAGLFEGGVRGRVRANEQAHMYILYIYISKPQKCGNSGYKYYLVFYDYISIYMYIIITYTCT